MNERRSAACVADVCSPSICWYGQLHGGQGSELQLQLVCFEVDHPGRPQGDAPSKGFVLIVVSFQQVQLLSHWSSIQVCTPSHCRTATEATSLCAIVSGPSGLTVCHGVRLHELQGTSTIALYRTAEQLCPMIWTTAWKAPLAGAECLKAAWLNISQLTGSAQIVTVWTCCGEHCLLL